MHRADGGELKSNPTSVLGINEIAPMTMAAAYAAVANNGVYCKPIAIDQVTDAEGKKLGGQSKECKQAIEPAVAQAAVYAMKGTISGGTAVGAQTYDGTQLFGKTGTTDSPTRSGSSARAPVSRPPTGRATRTARNSTCGTSATG